MEFFEKLKEREAFFVGLWELKPDYEDINYRSDYNAEVRHPAFLENMQLSFIKTGSDSCMETKTGTEFVLEGCHMKNDETGLSFIATMVNDKPTKYVIPDAWAEMYFDYAKELKAKDNKKSARTLK